MLGSSESILCRAWGTALHERASAHVHWVAGHGGDVSTLRTYLDSLLVFKSHWQEWSAHLSPYDIYASIPALHSLSLNEIEGDAREEGGIPHPVPPAISVVVTLSLQRKIMRDQTHDNITHNFDIETLDALLSNSLGMKR
jgi:hypothetical protein